MKKKYDYKLVFTAGEEEFIFEIPSCVKDLYIYISNLMNSKFIRIRQRGCSYNVYMPTATVSKIELFRVYGEVVEQINIDEYGKQC